MLAAGWAVALGFSWSTFFHHLSERSSFEQLTLVDIGLGLLLVTAILGVALCVGSRGNVLRGLPRARPQPDSENLHELA